MSPDNAGNITAADNVVYTYGNEEWKDLLTAYNGRAITYDQIGNPTKDGIWNYTWEHGRQLSSMSKEDNTCTWSFTYDADGLRTGRSNGTDTYSYVYNGGSLSKLTKGSDTLYFTYDANGTPLTVNYNGVVYYYITNLQGDVTSIIDAEGKTAADYQYNAWGNPIAEDGESPSPLETLNPLRYRGYVYDQETGLYYLQSRYYNPEMGRFINADVFASTGQGLLGNNMFAYCGNNPISRKDDGGEFWEIVAAGAVVSLISGVANALSTAYSGGSLQECLAAGIAGMAGGLAGFVVSAVSGFSPQGSLAGRGVATFVTDLATNWALNGKVTKTDVAFAAVDATFDVCFSTVTYYYNPVEAIFPRSVIDTVVDGAIDYAETTLLYSRCQTSAEARNIQKLTFKERRLAM